jgi:hypothetical protein
MLRHSVTPSSSRRRHGDGDLTGRPRTQTIQGNGIPVHRLVVWEPARKGTEEREHHSRARVQEHPRRRAHGEVAPERVDVCGGPRATPSPPGRDIFRSRMRGKSSLPGGGSLQAQRITYATTSEDGGWNRSRQMLRGAQHTPQPGVVRGQGSMGGSMEVKGSVGSRLL